MSACVPPSRARIIQWPALESNALCSDLKQDSVRRFPVLRSPLPVPPLTRESCDCQTADGCFYRDGQAALAAFAIEEDEAPLSLALCLMFLVIYRILAYGTYSAKHFS